MSEYSLFEFMRQIEKAVNAEVLDKNDRHVLWHYIVHQHQTFEYIFADPVVGTHIDMGENLVENTRKYLHDLHIIKWERAYKPRQGYYITVCYDWNFMTWLKENGLINKSGVNKKWVKNELKELKKTGPKQTGAKETGLKQTGAKESGLNQPQLLLMSKEINESQESHESLEQGVDQREEKKEREETGGQAAVPASESATEESHSTGEPDLLRKIAPLPEKEEKPKKFIPPTKEEVRLELESLLEKKGTFQQWSDNDLRAMTDKFFDWYDASDWKKNNGQKLKDWQKSLNTTWLSKQHYLPERTTRNQPQQLAGQTMNEADVMAILTGRNTSQETFDAESNRISQNLENFQK